MCTVLTIDKETYQQASKKIERRIVTDWRMNSDGASLVFLDDKNPDLNTITRTMNCLALLRTLSMLMKGASPTARVFIHLRAATTFTVGVAYTHAFDDLDGVIYMHNGMIKNPSNLAVDSFRLVTEANHTPEALFERLNADGERFANIFRIDTNTYQYSMIRQLVGTLYTDGKGNFSTHKVASLKKEVPPHTLEKFDMVPEETEEDFSEYYTDLAGWSLVKSV